jgi:uncharacterized membrane protein YbhN (UPF0104 family)
MRWLVAALALGGLVYAVAHFGDVSRFAELARRADPWWLLVALVLQASTYVSIALGWKAVLVRAGAPQPLPRLVPFGLLKVFVDQVVPAGGIGGNLLLAGQLRAIGAPRRIAVAAVLVSIIGYHGAYAAVALAMLAALWALGHSTAVAGGLVGALLLAVVGVFALAYWLQHRGRRPLPHWLRRFAPVRKLFAMIGEAPAELLRDPRLLFRVSLCNALVFLADAATLAACLCALGMPWMPATAFIAFIVASIVATLGPIPMGLGSFEAASTAMLSALGVPLEIAFGATLLLRVLTLWLPMLPGFVLMRRLRRRERSETVPATAAPQPR